MNSEALPLGEHVVRDAARRGKTICFPEPSPGLCYICGCAFKEEDFSTFFTIKGELSVSLAHDECLELLRHGMWKDKPLFELGHKIWGKQ